MARTVTPTGECSYNGIQFPAPFKGRVQAHESYDRSDRSVVKVVYTFLIEATFVSDDSFYWTGPGVPASTAGAQLDTHMELLQRRLSEPGKAFKYHDQGLGEVTGGTGNFEVNTNSTTMDIAFGPKPRVLQMEPIGSNRAWRVVWTLEVSLPKCSDSDPVRIGSVTEYTYDITFDINRFGATVRTISGTLSIANNRLFLNSGFVGDTVDAYRNRIKIPVPIGFDREQSFQISRDHSTIEFRIVDTEIMSEFPYPQGISDVDMTQSWDSGLDNSGTFSGEGFLSWGCELRATISYEPNHPRHWPWFIFTMMVQSRIAAKAPIAKITKVDRQNKQHSRIGGYFPYHFTITEHGYTRQFEFSLRYMLYADLQTFFQASGVFLQPVPGTWATWTHSVRDAQSLRGTARMQHLAGDDLIVTICDQNIPTINNQARLIHSEQSPALYSPVCPDKKNSWLKYQNKTDILEDPNTVLHRKISNYSADNYTDKNGQVNIDEEGFILHPQQQAAAGTAASYIQSRGPRSVEVRIFGYAVRAGYAIPPPRLESIGGSKVFQNGVKSRFRQYIWKTTGKCNIYVALWDIYYTVENPPQGDLMKQLVTSGISEAYSP